MASPAVGGDTKVGRGNECTHSDSIHDMISVVDVQLTINNIVKD